MNVNRPITIEPLDKRELFASDLAMPLQAIHRPDYLDYFVDVIQSTAHDAGRSYFGDFEQTSFKIPVEISSLHLVPRPPRTWNFILPINQPNSKIFGKSVPWTGLAASPAEGEANIVATRPNLQVVHEVPTQVTLLVFTTPFLFVGNQSALTRTPFVTDNADSPDSLPRFQRSNQTNAPSINLNISSAPGLNTITNAASNRAMPESIVMQVRGLNEATSPSIASSNAIRNDPKPLEVPAESQVAPPSPQDMIDLGPTLRAALESTGAKSTASRSSPTDGRRTKVERSWIDSEVADRVFSLERLGKSSPLPIPADMVFLEFGSSSNSGPRTTDPVMGPFGINPLVLFQTFLHSEPIASVSNLDSLDNRPTDCPKEAQSANHLSTNSLGLVAIASTLWFAFSSRYRFTPPTASRKRPSKSDATSTST